MNPDELKNRGESELGRLAEKELEAMFEDTEGLAGMSPKDIASMIHELRVHQIELKMQNEELRRIQGELERARDQYSHLYDFAPVGYFTLSDKGLIMEANLTGAAILGVERSLLTGKPFSNFIAGDYQDGFYFLRKNMLEIKTLQAGEVKLVKKDGTQFYAQLDSIMVKDTDGNIAQTRMVITDITGRKRTEAALKERVKELQCLYGMSALLELPGISLHEILKKTATLIPPAWQFPEITAACIVLDGQSFQTENFRETPWMQASKIIVHDKLVGQVEVCYLEEQPASDEGPFLTEERNLLNVIAERLGAVVERMRVEEALRESQERLDFVLKGSQLGLWDWNIETNEVKRNERWAEMLGYKLQEIEFTVKQWLDFIHPDDRSMAYQSIQDHLEGRFPIHKIEYRMLTKDGQYRWILDQARVVKYDFHGRPIRMSGTHTDVTERKRAEEQIKASLKDKEILLREVHHRVKNNFQTIISLLRLQSQKIEVKQYADMFQDCQDRIRSMALIHEKMYNSKDIAKVDLAEYVKSLVKDLAAAYGVDPTIIKITVEVEDVGLELESAIPLGLIINELVSNALKHAISKERNVHIIVGLRPIDEAELELTVADDGIGILEDFDISQCDTMGLTLVKVLAEHQLRGKIEVNRSKGTQFAIRFKRARYRPRM